jgi:hypothetical protein
VHLVFLARCNQRGGSESGRRQHAKFGSVALQIIFKYKREVGVWEDVKDGKRVEGGGADRKTGDERRRC